MGNVVTHKQQCLELEREDRVEKSKEYGINRHSVLNKLTYFHVCDGSLLPDVMHHVLEGALQYEIKLMLQVMIYQVYFTLDSLTSRLENMELGYMQAKNRPTPITEKTLRSSGLTLKQNGKHNTKINDFLNFSASQMWQMFTIF